MKIKSLQLKNFKRFTDLTLQDIPESAKLVLLIGSNGSGKSSVFDAFESISNVKKDNLHANFEELNLYYKKNKNNPYSITLDIYNKGKFTKIDSSWQLSNNQQHLDVHNFYGRTSFRQVPKLQRTQLGQAGRIILEKDSDRPRMYIEKDNRFESDIELITEFILKEFFRSNKSTEQIKERYINPINIALANVFSKSSDTQPKLIEIIPPLEGKVAQINFQKGNTEIHYNYLSAGEKEVVNIFFNLLSRRDLYKDTVYFLDELDLHLNTFLQRNLIKEIVENWIPENCQLWTASHSLGFIQYSKETESSVIFDFDDYNFDEPKILTPEPKDNPNIYQIAVDKDILPSLFRHFNIVFVENKDKDFYAPVGIQNTLFVPENGRNGVYHKVKSGEFHGIVDRDFLTDDDITAIEKEYKRLKILRYYSIENYLYHPDNLSEYYSKVGHDYSKASYIQKLTTEKNNVKDSIILSLSLKRTEYPYFKEPEFNGKANQKRFKNEKENFDQTAILAGYLNSDQFEDYYKILPMKSYATHLIERQTVSKSDLAKTNWFKEQIKNLLST